jgi:Tfp pilus assembly protein FimT
MSLRKHGSPQQTSAGLSLLQGLFVLAILGVIVAIVAANFAS